LGHDSLLLALWNSIGKEKNERNCDEPKSSSPVRRGARRRVLAYLKVCHGLPVGLGGTALSCRFSRKRGRHSLLLKQQQQERKENAMKPRVKERQAVETVRGKEAVRPLARLMARALTTEQLASVRGGQICPAHPEPPDREEQFPISDRPRPDPMPLAGLDRRPRR
jgi:hypothetical protein